MISQNRIDLELQTEAPEAQEESSGSSRLVLWLVVFSLGILFLPLYLISTTIQESTLPLQAEYATLEAELQTTPAPNPEEERLRSELLTLNQQISALETVGDNLVANHVDWPRIMAVIAAYDQDRIQLTEVVQAETRVTLSGVADDENTVTAYAESLRGSEQFVDIAVQSMNLKTLPTATPVRNPTPLPDGENQADAVSPELTITRVVEFTILTTLRTGRDGQPE